VGELTPGLWHRQAPHHGWQPGGPWNPTVSSYGLPLDRPVEHVLAAYDGPFDRAALEPALG
jgi:hypothetical protein